jgi:hypothetical protein
VNVIKELNDNIIGIDFKHQLTYNVINQQVKFARSIANSNSPIKQTVLPAMTPTVIKAKYKGVQDPQATYVANICTPRTPMVSGVPSIVSIDEHRLLYKTALHMTSNLTETTSYVSWKLKMNNWYL